MSYDGQSGLPTTQKNAFAQATTTNYDSNQGQVPISTVDANAQTTSIAYSYDASGNQDRAGQSPR